MQLKSENQPWRTILLLEDNYEDEVLARRAVEESDTNTSIRVVNSTENALKLLNLDNSNSAMINNQAFIPDLILISLNHEYSSNIDFIGIIKEKLKERRIPVLILAKLISKSAVQLSYKLNADAFIQKPQNFNKYKELMSMISDYYFNLILLPDQMPTTG